MWKGNCADLLMAPISRSSVTAVAPLHSTPGKQRDRGRRLSRSGKRFGKLQRAIQRVGQRRAGEKGDIPDPQKREGPEGAVQRRGVGVVVNQEIEKIRQNLPEEKQHHEIAAGDHAKQHADGNAEQGEIPAFVRFLIHVVDGVGIDDRPDGGDEHHHDRAETVDVEAERHGNEPARVGS